jgi:oligosaccharide repeat unit polymerase
MMGLFNYGSLFLSLFFKEIDFKTINSLIKQQYPEKIIQKTLMIYTLSLVTFHMSYIFSHKKSLKIFQNKSLHNNNFEYSHNQKMLFIGKMMMLTSGFLVVWRVKIEVEYLKENFVKIYIGGSSALPIPFYLRLGSVLFKSGYMMILASLPTKSTFKKYSFLNLGLMIPQLVIGYRGAFAVSIIFILWYYIKIYDTKSNYKKIIIGGFVLVIVLQIIAFTRERGYMNEVKITNVFLMFFVSQSNSFNVLPLYIQFKDIMVPHNYPFILDPIISMIIRADGQSLEVLERRSSLGHQLVYTINPSYYLGGTSLGTTLTAELYEFGIIGIIIGSVLFSWYIAKFNMLLTQKRWILFLSYIFAYHIMTSPRGSFLPNIYEILRLSIFSLIVFYFFNFTKNKDKIYEVTVINKC